MTDITPDTQVAKLKKQEHAVRLTDYYTAIARQLAAQQEKNFAEFLGDACEIGIQSLAEQANKMNIWRRTSLKAELITAIDSVPQEKLEEAIEALKKLKG